MSIATISPIKAAAGSTNSRNTPPASLRKSSRDVGFAIGIVAILSIFFLPIPSFLIDLGLAFSIALSVLILMVALWIERPLEFRPSRPSCWSRHFCACRSISRPRV